MLILSNVPVQLEKLFHSCSVRAKRTVRLEKSSRTFDELYCVNVLDYLNSLNEIVKA